MGRTQIEVRSAGGGEPIEFEVTLRENKSETRHRVTLARADHARLAAGRPPEKLVEAAFRFLLDREPKESILARFDLMVIARYFPEFEREIGRYLS